MKKRDVHPPNFSLLNAKVDSTEEQHAVEAEFDARQGEKAISMSVVEF